MSEHVDCDMVARRLDAYLDGELPPEELDQLSAHLRACFPCADRTDFGQQLKALVRQRCEEHAPPELVARIRSHLTSPA